MLCNTCKAVCLEDVEFSDMTCPHCGTRQSACNDCIENGDIKCVECDKYFKP